MLIEGILFSSEGTPIPFYKLQHRFHKKKKSYLTNHFVGLKHKFQIQAEIINNVAHSCNIKKDIS